MKTLKSWACQGRENAAVTLATDGARVLRLTVLEHDLIRVSLTHAKGWRQGRTWSIAPLEDVPVEGRSRDLTSGFTCPDFTVEKDRAPPDHRNRASAGYRGYAFAADMAGAFW